MRIGVQFATLVSPRRLVRAVWGRLRSPFMLHYLYAIRQAAVILVGGILSKGGRRRIRQLAVALGYGPTPRLPIVSLRTVVGSDVPIRICDSEITDWNVRLVDLVAINAVVSRYAPQAAFEIGTGDGLTALNIAGNMSDGARLYTLNLPPEQAGIPQDRAVGERFHGSAVAGRITQMFGDSKHYDFTRFYGTMDLVFIDGDHSAEAVAHDTNEALRLVRREGGVILWHDYGLRRGVTEVVDALGRRRGLDGDLVAIQGTWIACFVHGTPRPGVGG
jgi:predicted O-methyltransferase YrrM